MVIGELEQLLPVFLQGESKEKLKNSLKQFFEDGSDGKIYTDFFSQHKAENFIQGDLVREVRFPVWDHEANEFSKGYFDAMLISNSCDVSPANQRDIPKNAVFAPIIEKNEYYSDLIANDDLSKEQIDSFDDSIRKQLVTNLLYLPANQVDQKEYIVFLDKIFSFPTEELREIEKDIEESRISSLDYFGLYIFLIKTAHHFCRPPAEKDRG